MSDDEVIEDEVIDLDDEADFDDDGADLADDDLLVDVEMTEEESIREIE